MEARKTEVLQSPRWSNTRVAEYSFRWLKGNAYSDVGGTSSQKDAVGVILHRMFLDVEFAMSVFEILDLWKS
jgi:hypothetical protein